MLVHQRLTTPSDRMGSATPSTTSPLTAVERSLRDSLLVSEFRDVYLYAFSRRTILPDGTLKIDHPLPVVTISSILKNTESFSKLLVDPDAVQQQAPSSEYDYESDSDLDEFEELQVECRDTSSTSPGPAPAEGSSSEANTKDKIEDPTNDQAAVNGSTVAATQRYLQVPVPNIAYRTLRACVFYLYTGKINFLPLTSSGALGRRLALLMPSNDLAPQCSPKSMYRLAELYGLTELRDLAYDEIISQLKLENILEEVFSSFFVRYDRLREDAISYLCQSYSTSAVQESLPDIIQRVALGEKPHANVVLRSLLSLPAVISLQAWGQVSQSRAIKPSHLVGKKPITPPLSANNLQLRSISKPEEPSQPAVASGASLGVALAPAPPSESTPPTASDPSSSIALSALARDIIDKVMLQALSTETTARAGAEGDDGSRGLAPTQTPVGPGVAQAAQLTETRAVRPDQVLRKGKKKKGKPRPPVQPFVGTTSTSAGLSNPDAPRSPPIRQSGLLRLGTLGSASCGAVRSSIWPPGYGPVQKREETDGS